MLFCLSYCNDQKRVILDEDSHGDTLAVIEADSWVEARQEVELCPALDAFSYQEGRGWVRRG